MPSMTIAVTQEQWDWGSAKLGAQMKLQDANGAPRAATAAEFKGWVINLVRDGLHAAERDQQIQAIEAQKSALTTTPFDPV